MGDIHSAAEQIARLIERRDGPGDPGHGLRSGCAKLLRCLFRGFEAGRPLCRVRRSWAPTWSASRAARARGPARIRTQMSVAHNAGGPLPRRGPLRRGPRFRSDLTGRGRPTLGQTAGGKPVGSIALA